MTIEEMQRRKKELNYTYAELASMTGLTLSTVQKVLGGFTKSPRYSTIQALELVLKPKKIQNPHRESSLYEYSEDASEPVDVDTYHHHNSKYEVSVRENAPQYDYNYVGKCPSWARNAKYPRQGSYTLEDYLALPDDQRVELINGVFYDMSAPSTVHQLVAGKIYAMLLAHQAEHPDCHVFIAPTDVQLDCDDQTILEPDVFVVCAVQKITRERIFGAPDFIIEVLSESTRRKDVQIKLGKYGNAGVKEYWMVDPDRKNIIVYDFAHDDKISLYTFQDTVPVSVSSGTVSIDFREIQKEIAFLEES